MGIMRRGVAPALACGSVVVTAAAPPASAPAAAALETAPFPLSVVASRLAGGKGRGLGVGGLPWLCRDALLLLTSPAPPPGSWRPAGCASGQAVPLFAGSGSVSERRRPLGSSFTSSNGMSGEGDLRRPPSCSAPRPLAFASLRSRAPLPPRRSVRESAVCRRWRSSRCSPSPGKYAGGASALEGDLDCAAAGCCTAGAPVAVRSSLVGATGARTTAAAAVPCFTTTLPDPAVSVLALACPDSDSGSTGADTGCRGWIMSLVVVFVLVLFCARSKSSRRSLYCAPETLGRLPGKRGR